MVIYQELIKYDIVKEICGNPSNLQPCEMICHLYANCGFFNILIWWSNHHFQYYNQTHNAFLNSHHDFFCNHHVSCEYHAWSWLHMVHYVTMIHIKNILCCYNTLLLVQSYIFTFHVMYRKHMSIHSYMWPNTLYVCPCTTTYMYVIESVVCHLHYIICTLDDALPSHGVKPTWGFHKVKLRKVETWRHAPGFQL
jgi:hypothetical protein